MRKNTTKYSKSQQTTEAEAGHFCILTVMNLDGNCFHLCTVFLCMLRYRGCEGLYCLVFSLAMLQRRNLRTVFLFWLMPLFSVIRLKFSNLFKVSNFILNYTRS